MACADEFDPVVKSAAVWALCSIAKHNAELAQEVIKANALETIIQCVQEPELKLKRIAV